MPEMNNGQLIKLIRDRYLVDAQPLNKIKGMPFEAQEIKSAILNMLNVKYIITNKLTSLK
mgnify:CR=1 FL=1